MENIIALIVPILVGFLIFKVVKSQVGCIWKIIVNSLSGLVCLWLLNLLSGITGIVLPINFISCLLVGALGIPGIIVLVLLHLF